MKVILRDDESGVSEVIGTILILAMTVVLFATIIIWVTNIPTPTAAARLEIEGSLNPLYDAFGVESGGNITLRHLGGESLPAAATALYVTVERGSTFDTEILQTKGVVQPPAINQGQLYGLMDGPDAMWNTGERWSLTNRSIRPSADSVTVQIIDTVRSILLWQQRLSPPAGTRPPLFLEKWADNLPSTAIIDPVETGQEFWIFAKVTDPDGDLDNASVYGIITYFYGTADSCATPQRMYDDGTRGDLVPRDGIFTLSRKCMKSPTLDWDGTYVLFNATDRAGHRTTSRMALDVILGPASGPGGNGTGGTGRPGNLRWNGRQGYNIFNATQWDKFKYTAKEVRTFRGSEEIVVVVGSLDLENTFVQNQYLVWDPFSGYPPQAVVYGSAKSVTQTSEPSSTQAFTFLQFINGYYIFTYRFHLNDAATVGTNFYRTPTHPPNYYFARYSLDILLQSSSGIRFNTTDSVNITDEDGFYRNFPQVSTYSDAGFSLATQTFASTDVVYVEVSMFTVDPVVDPNVIFGNVIIKDYAGGTQLWKAPKDIPANNQNPPICRVNDLLLCQSGDAITLDAIRRVYRFAINLSRADQDPWVEGTQNYAFTLSSVRDTDELYAQISAQLVIVAPLYKLDVIIGNEDTTSNAWGTHDYSYYYENVNGLDRWRKERVEFCGLGGTSCAPLEKTVAVVFLDFDRDGDLDTGGSLFIDNNDARMYLYRRDLDFTGNVIFTRFLLEDQANVYCKALSAGDVTGDGAAEIVCGATNGHVWYYKNDGSWHDGLATRVSVDTTRAEAVNSVAIADFNGDGANDIAVGGASARVTWYPNLDGLGKFQNIGIVDDWFSDGEQTPKGNITSGSFLNTYVDDSVYEQIREYTITEPVQTGGTTNPTFNAGSTGWTYADWQEPGTAASGSWVAAGGVGGTGYVSVSTNHVANQFVAGYWYQAVTTTGSPPFTANVGFDWSVTSFEATGGSVTLYVFVDTTSGAPILGQQVWSSGPQTATTGWSAVAPFDVSSKITGPGTYYLKIAVRTQNMATGSASAGGFDGAALTWSSAGGLVSEMEHYWRFTQLPSRPGTTFTLYLEGRHSANAEGDFFAIAYSTNVVGNNPLTGTYTTVLWVNTTGDILYNYILPVSVSGKILWTRVIDMDRKVGNVNLDTLFVDRMYVRADTPAGTTGASLTNPGDAGAVNAIDADDQDADGYADLVVGTANGKIFKYTGGAGGLQTPSAAFWTHPNPVKAIVGVKFGQVSGSQAGLEIVFGAGTTVRVLTGFGSSAIVINNGLPAYGSGSAMMSFGAGDVNGDGWDDVVIGTGGTKVGEVWFWENQNHGLTWSNPIQIDNVGTSVLWLDLGDASRSQYLGR